MIEENTAEDALEAFPAEEEDWIKGLKLASPQSTWLSHSACLPACDKWD
jgi:hypothetical protein